MLPSENSSESSNNRSRVTFFAIVSGLSLLFLTSLVWIYQARAAACTETVATNGTQSVSGTNYTSRVITFTGAGCTDTFEIPARATVEILAVGGGGGGGGGNGVEGSGTNSGGGGGGGVFETLNSTPCFFDTCAIVAH